MKMNTKYANRLADIPDSKRIEFHTKYIKLPSDCWEWQGLIHFGYGMLHINKRYIQAHRISWMLANNQDWPNDKIARHTCNNRKCCNPNHIMPGTDWENTSLDRTSEWNNNIAVAIRKRVAKKCVTPWGTFDSITDAAKANNESYQSVYYRFNKFKKPGYELI